LAVKKPDEPRGTSLRGRIGTLVASIRTRFLLVNAFLVLVPLAGLSFARTYERELLRSEEDGMVAIARTLSAVAASDLDGDQIVYRGALRASVAAAARDLRAQVRVLDAQGSPLADTGAEELPKQTKGRTLLEPSTEGARIRSILPEDMPASPPWPSTTSRLRLDSAPVETSTPEQPRATFAGAPEVKKALGGASGRYTRVPAEFRGVRLYVAEPIKHDERVVGVVYVSRTTYPVLVALYRARDGLYRVAGLSLFFAVVIAAVLGFTIARPLRQLGQAAGRIARGERGVSLRMKGNDEIAELARAFDTMSHELDARLSYISELSANVSHELKTPLASIRGSAELLRDGAADDPAARERFLGHILTDTERMTRLVSRLLELSRIEASHEVRLPVDYRVLVEEEIDAFRAAGKPVSLVWSSEAALLRGLPDHLVAALRSLIDNGLRHGNAQGVSVRVAREGEWLRTDVIDHGTGISQANLDKIWERFFTTERARGGTGIGLSIVRAEVEAHGGTVHVASTPGEGACFSFRLPLMVG
jgi:two-component system sensor histidine kinase ChvG